MTPPEIPARDHPAKYSRPVLDAFADEVITFAEQSMLGRGNHGGGTMRILDPFAGTGRIHELAGIYAPPCDRIETVGVELEPEWQVHDERTIVGDALQVVEYFGAGSFDLLMTSPVFPNRMTDHHDARDKCARCKGEGVLVDPLAENGEAVCPDCRGSKLSKRNTYKANLQRDPSPGSSAIMKWGPEYRRFHRDCLAEFRHVVRPGGRLVVNMKNHKVTERKGQPPVEQLVVEWWLATMLAQDLRLVRAIPVYAKGNRQGENGHTLRDENIDDDPRVDVEYVLVAERPVGR